MIVYSHPKEENPSEHVIFGTVREAQQSAQELADKSGKPVEVTRYRVRKGEMPIRDLIIALLTDEGWCSERSLVRVCLPKAR